MNTARKPHLLFISYYFPPMGGGGVQRLVKFLKFWDYRRFSVSVLTVKPSYFYAEDASLINDVPSQPVIYRCGSLDPFRLLYIFKKLRPKPSRSGEATRRESGKRLRRLAQYIFLPDSRILWLPFALLKIARIHRRHPIDLIIASLPPFTAGVIARRAQRLFGIPAVLDFRDSWTDNPYLPAPPQWHRNLQQRQEAGTVKAATTAIFVNPRLRDYYLASYPILNNSNSRVIRNGYDPDDFPSQSLPVKPAGERPFRIGIMGTVYSQGNAPLPLLQAVADLRKTDPAAGEKIRLVFIGKWTAEFLSLLRSHPFPDQIEQIPYLPHRDALKFAAGLDALALAVQSYVPGSENVTPGRIYEYLYLRRPILAMCPLTSDLAFLVRDCQAGEVVDYEDRQSLTAVLRRWLAGEGFPENYRFVNLDRYTRRAQTHELMDFLTQIIIGFTAEK